MRRTSCSLIEILIDIKSDNILVKLPKSPEADIDKWLSENGAELLGYPIKLEGHELPVHLALSQPLPNFGVNKDLSNISICLIDYSEGNVPQLCSV
jgi:hypothetical protein